MIFGVDISNAGYRYVNVEKEEINSGNAVFKVIGEVRHVPNTWPH